MKSRKGVALFDWDYTLEDFPNEKGIGSIQGKSPEVTTMLQRAFSYFFARSNAISRGLEHHEDAPLAGLDNEYETQRNAVRITIDARPHDMFWSREVWACAALACIADGKSSSNEEGIAIANAYWKGVSGHARPYPEATALFDMLKREGWEIAIVTSSDRRLTLDDNGSFVYDPEYSRQLKEQRLRSSELGKLIDDIAIIVGDPISKPQPEFWQRVVQTKAIKPEEPVVMTGDSYATDIKGLKDAPFGFATILMDRDGKYKNTYTPDASTIVSHLAQVQEWIGKEGNVQRRL